MQQQTGRRQALVIGASSSIGQAVCHRFLANDFDVIAHFAKSGDVLTGLAARDSRLTPVQCDLTDLDAAAKLAAAHTDVDVIVFLAALATPCSLEQADPELLSQTLNVGAVSNFVMMGTIGPAMAERGWGRIIIGSSIGVKFGGGSDSFAYALANHTAEFIPRAAREWASKGVLTNVVRIGATDTPLHANFAGRDLDQRAALIPIGRLATVAEVADFIFWHGSENNTFVTGQVTSISGGE